MAERGSILGFRPEAAAIQNVAPNVTPASGRRVPVESSAVSLPAVEEELRRLTELSERKRRFASVNPPMIVQAVSQRPIGDEILAQVPPTRSIHPAMRNAE